MPSSKEELTAAMARIADALAWMRGPLGEMIYLGDKIPHIQSTKSLTGHSLGAAGVQESIYSLLMMQAGFIGESAHITELDPEFDGVPIVRKRIDDAKIDIALSNSFGFGGTNATLVFSRLDA